MYLRIGDLVVNTAHLVHARVEGGDGERRVLLTMTVGELRLAGDDAEAFLRALPVYEPVREAE